MNRTFESALQELEKIVKELESGNIELEKAIEQYTEAMKLVKFCSEKLNHASESVTQILKENGELANFEIKEEEKE